MDTGGGSGLSLRSAEMQYCKICDQTMRNVTLMKGHLLSNTHQRKARGAALSFTELESSYLFITVAAELAEVNFWDIFEVFRTIGHVTDFRFIGRPKPELGTKIYLKYRKKGAATRALRESNHGRLMIGSTAFKLEEAETEYPSPEPPVEQAVEEEEEEEEAPRASGPTDHTALLTELTQQLSDGSEDDALCWLTDQLVLTPAEDQQRIKYCQQLQETLRSRYSTCLVDAFGSSVTGLGLRGCDLDLYAFIDAKDAGYGLQPNADQSQKVRAMAKFLEILPHLCSNVAVRFSLGCLPTATFQAFPLGDVHCCMNLMGPMLCQNSRLIGMLMKTDPRVRPLTVVVRYWAQRRCLAGGEAHPLKMSSYCLTLLVVTFLQQLQPPVLPTVDACQAEAAEELMIGPWNATVATPIGWRSENTSSISQLLREFFRFYAEQFVTEQSALCPLMGKVLPRHQLKDPLAGRELARPAAWTAYCDGLAEAMEDNTALVVQDPIMLNVNVARNYRQLGLYRFGHCCKQAAEMPLDRLFEEEELPRMNRSAVEQTEAACPSVRTLAAVAETSDPAAAEVTEAAPAKDTAVPAAKKTETAAAEVAISETHAVTGTDKRTLESTGDQIKEPAAKRTKHSDGGDDGGQSREISSSVAGTSSQLAADLPSGGPTGMPANDPRWTYATMNTGGGSGVSKMSSNMLYCSVCDETMKDSDITMGHLLGYTHQYQARRAALSSTGEERSRCFYISVSQKLSKATVRQIFLALERIGPLADFRFTGKPKPRLGTLIFIKYQKRGSGDQAMNACHANNLFAGGAFIHLKRLKANTNTGMPMPEHDDDEDEDEIPVVEDVDEETPRARDPIDHTALLIALTHQLCIFSEDTALCLLIDQLVLTPAEHQHRTFYCNELQNALRYRFHGCSLWVFGSTVSGLGLRGCDLDLYAFIDPNSGLPPDADQAAKVRAVAKWLARQPQLCANVVRTPTALVPSIKFRAPPLGFIRCGLNLSSQNKDRMACQNSRLIGMLMSTDPRVRPLTVAVRYWAQRRCLAGGEAHPLKMSSYCLTLLVVTFLQQLQPPVLPTVDACQAAAEQDLMVGSWYAAFGPPVGWRSANTSSISQLLREFFHFYATFVAEQSALCPLMGKVLPRHQLKDPLAGRELARPAGWAAHCVGLAEAMEDDTALVVQDPIELNFNVARNYRQLGLNRFRHCCKQAGEMPLGRLFEEEAMPEMEKNAVEEAEAAGIAVRTLAEAAARAAAVAEEEADSAAEDEEDNDEDNDEEEEEEAADAEAVVAKLAAVAAAKEAEAVAAKLAAVAAAKEAEAAAAKVAAVAAAVRMKAATAAKAKATATAAKEAKAAAAKDTAVAAAKKTETAAAEVAEAAAAREAEAAAAKDTAVAAAKKTETAAAEVAEAAAAREAEAAAAKETSVAAAKKTETAAAEVAEAAAAKESGAAGEAEAAAAKDTAVAASKKTETAAAEVAEAAAAKEAGATGEAEAAAANGTAVAASKKTETAAAEVAEAAAAKEAGAAGEAEAAAAKETSVAAAKKTETAAAEVAISESRTVTGTDKRTLESTGHHIEDPFVKRVKHSSGGDDGQSREISSSDAGVSSQSALRLPSGGETRSTRRVIERPAPGSSSAPLAGGDVKSVTTIATAPPRNVAAVQYEYYRKCAAAAAAATAVNRKLESIRAERFGGLAKPSSETPSSETRALETRPSGTRSSETRSSETQSSNTPSSGMTSSETQSTKVPPSETPLSKTTSSDTPPSKVPSRGTRPSEVPLSETPSPKTTVTVASDPAVLRRVLSDFDRPPSRLIVLPLDGPDGRRWSPSSWRCSESAEACARFLDELFTEVLHFECTTMSFDQLDLPLNVVRGYQCEVLLPIWRYRRMAFSDLADRRSKHDLAFEAEVTERALRQHRHSPVPATLATFSCYLVLLEDEEQPKVCLYEGKTTDAGQNCFSFLESYLPEVTSRCMVHYARDGRAQR